jgi:putative polyhydroxyalkanoate system protein
VPPRYRLAGTLSRIYLRREHELTPKAARTKVERIAELLAKRFDASCEWRGDVLSISHPSVNGKVVVGEDDVVVEAKLGFLLAMFRDRIDEELVRILDKEFPEPKKA